MARPKAVITGASAGIGAAVALAMAPKFDLTLIARRRARLEQVRDEVQRSTPDCQVAVIELDVGAITDGAAAASLMPDRISCLVNNAGLARGADAAEKCLAADWREMIATNVTGLTLLTLALLPHIEAGGSIINLGSTAGSWPYRGGNVYGATKAFVRQLSDNLRIDLASRRIRVCDVQPGIVATEFSVTRYKGDEAAAARVYADKLSLTAEDVARSVAWVASLPVRACVSKIELVPVTQAYGGFE